MGLLIWSCKDKIEENAVADFSLLNTTILENNLLQITNMSKHSNTFEWKINELGLTYSGNNPNILMDTAGKFTLRLTAKGGNGSIAKKELIFEVQVDTLWRISKNNEKAWQIQSILYNGVEQMDAECKKDDILKFKFFNSGSMVDSFELNEGINKCASGSYLFNMPSTGIWQFNTKTRAIDLALDVLGSPVNFNFKIDKLYKSLLIAKDNGNNAQITLVN